MPGLRPAETMVGRKFPIGSKGIAVGIYLNDPEMIEETKYWIEGVFASCQPDGYFGPVNERNGKRELGHR